MPILAPEIQRAMRAVGLIQDPSKTTLVEKLDYNNLGLDQIISRLALLIENTGNESLQKSAIEIALKLHGALKEQVAPIPSITIVIEDRFVEVNGSLSNRNGELHNKINPILIPRKTCLALVEPSFSDNSDNSDNACSI